MAERVGFEPTVPLPAHVLSRHADSAALAPLHRSHESFKDAMITCTSLGGKPSLRTTNGCNELHDLHENSTSAEDFLVQKLVQYALFF
jgi:hypothetical protein